MNRETIERLAIDSAAGELNEDVEALFQSYLAGHQQAKRWAEDVRQVYHETEVAIKAKTAPAGSRTTVMRIKPVSPVRWMPVARWAAVLVFGAIIGFTAGHWEIPGNTHRMAFQETSHNPKPVETVTGLKEKYVGTFWGDKMLALLEHQPGQKHIADLRDIKSWDMYRQYVKEKHNE
jgi:hypothetical protein